jgi:hypothetical protein
MQVDQAINRKQEEFGMTKSLRRIAAFGVLLLGAAVTISAAEPAQKLFNAEQESFLATPVSNIEHTAKVNFIATPGEVVCLGQPVEFTVSYSQKDEYTLAPLVLEPLALLPTGGMGTLTTSVTSGIVNTPSAKVDVGPGYVQIRYTPIDTVTVTMETVLNYPKVHLTVNDVTSFKVEKCKTYNMTIQAWVSKVRNEEVVISWTDAKGTLSATDTEVFGTLDILGGYGLLPVDEAVICDYAASVGRGKVHITGVRDGKAGFILKLVYDKLTGWGPAKEFACKDRITGKVTPKKLKVPAIEEYDPSKDLETTLKIYGSTPKAMGYTGAYAQSGGKAEYRIDLVE